MRNLLLVSMGLTTLLLSGGIADQPKTSVPASSPTVVPAGANQVDRVVAHLLRAADHLEAAGLYADAGRVRREAGQRAMPEDILNHKEAELACLQQEVDRLRELAGQASGVIVDVMVVEVNRSKLGLKTGEFDKLVGFSPCPAGQDPLESREPLPIQPRPEGEAGIVDANPAILPLFRELQERGALDIVAHQTLLVWSGRSGSISTGGDVPVIAADAEKAAHVRKLAVGAEVEVVADILANQRVRLQAAVSLRRLNGRRIVDTQGSVHQGATSRRLNTEAEVELGQTLAIGRMAHDNLDVPTAEGAAAPQQAKPSDSRANSAADPVETIVFVTPRLVSAAGTPRPQPIDSASVADGPSDGVDPVQFIPVKGAKFGPPVPIMKRPK